MKSIQDSVARLFYTHGLFCASHPFSILSITICFMLFTFYPLYGTPFPGNIPQEYISPIREFENFASQRPAAQPMAGIQKKVEPLQPRWVKGPPVGYIQQIVIKAAVFPWRSEFLVPTDAFRAPLSKVFDVIRRLDSMTYFDGTEEKSLADICLRVSETITSKQVKGILPEYACLEVSPANFWNKDKKKFMEDGEILRTIFKKYGQALDTVAYLKEILLGVPWIHSGVSRYFIRNRQRTITFAVTVVLKKYDKGFNNALRKALEDVFPDTAHTVNNSRVDHIVHMHFKENRLLLTYRPLILTYSVLLLYMYFSVRKIEMVKSKWGLAFSAVVTIVSSLFMSISFCLVFGLTPTLNGGEIFPYLVVIIGMENVIIITKSVVSTPVDLDVKYRIASGISKEGWSITKNLATELIIIMCGFFTFVPAIQEFALFALVGLLTDFFLQIVFFVTILSLDIRRMELSDLHKRRVSHTPDTGDMYDKIEPYIQCPVKSMMTTPTPATPSVQCLSSSSTPGSPPPTPATPAEMDDFFENSLFRRSRRLRLLYFWANTRMFQRLIMVCTVIWIALIVYKTGLVEHITNTTDSLNITAFSNADNSPGAKGQQKNGGAREDSLPGWSWRQYEDDEKGSPVEHKDLELFRQLSYNHWPTMFSFYNITLYGRFISILPTIHISTIVDPQEAVNMRHSSENEGKVPSQIIPENGKNVLPTVEKNEDTEPLKEDSMDPYLYLKYYNPEKFKKLYPKSGKELAITVMLVILSVICVSYFVVALYHVLCPRDYGRRRKSKSRQRKPGVYYKQIKESRPKILTGHSQEIECIVTDGHFIISSCLGGQLRVWDSVSGDCVTCIIRKSATPPVKRKPCLGRNIEDSDADLYDEYHGDSSPLVSDSSVIQHDIEQMSRGPRLRTGSKTKYISKSRKAFTFEPDLQSTINTNFSSLTNSSVDSNNILNSDVSVISSNEMSDSSLNDSSMISGYDFQSRFSDIYDEHRKLAVESGEVIPIDPRSNQEMWEEIRARSWSAGDLPMTLQHDASLFDAGFEHNQAPSVWCLTCCDGLIVAGCGNGRIEFWDGSSGSLKCLFGDCNVGVTAVCFNKNRVVAARLDGTIDFLEMETFQNPVHNTVQDTKHVKGHSRNYSQSNIPTSSSAKKPPGHMRNYSQSSIVTGSMRKWEEIIHVTQIKRVRAHQQPIISLQVTGGKVISASQDHTIKVFRIDDCVMLYSLHGHEDKITVLYVDKQPPYNAASGDADGCVRLWDLPTGSCVHKVKGHDGGIVALTCSTKYVISSGLDDHLLIWERNKGNIVHSLDLDPCGNNSISLLTNNLLVTGGQGCINLLDVNKGEILRTVHVGDADRMAFVHQIKVVENTVIVCDFASEMKVIHFPTVLEKAE